MKRSDTWLDVIDSKGEGMCKAGVAVDQKLQSIGLRVESLDPNAIIHPDSRWDILKIIAEILTRARLVHWSSIVYGGNMPFTGLSYR